MNFRPSFSLATNTTSFPRPPSTAPARRPTGPARSAPAAPHPTAPPSLTALSSVPISTASKVSFTFMFLAEERALGVPRLRGCAERAAAPEDSPRVAPVSSLRAVDGSAGLYRESRRGRDTHRGRLHQARVRADLRRVIVLVLLPRSQDDGPEPDLARAA